MSRADFLDTSALLALTNNRDSLHTRARAVMDQLRADRADAVTTDWVLAEFLNTAAKFPLRNAAGVAVQTIRSSAKVRVHEATRADWDRAFALYLQRNDKQWSFIDCASMATCRELGVTRVFTSDHHFAQAGFEVLMPASA